MLQTIESLKQELIKLQVAFNTCQKQVNRIDDEVNTVNAMDPAQKLDRIKRKLIEEVVIDKLTPIKRDFNVDFKQLRKYIEECMTKLGEHSNRHSNTQQQIDQMNVTILRQLKNTDNEKKLLDREINRLNEIDRIKVA